VSKRLAERCPHVHLLRTATEDDIASVLGLWEAAGSQPSASDTREGLVGLLERDPDGLLLAEAQGAIVGTLIAAWDGWRGSFYKLVVHPDHRRRGLATELLREGERHLRAHGAVRLTAIVVDDDPIAMSFWRAAGYEQQAHRARFTRTRPCRR
jgi:ribosomal protein S18 acetylase RimI-like enzyme